MRILVEPSESAALGNFGDIAMQQIAIQRIAHLFPDAQIQVLVDDPAGLPAYAANVEGLSTEGRKAWLAGLIPARRPLRGMAHWEGRLRARHVGAFAGWLGAAASLRSASHARALQGFLQTTATTDLLVVCGMGGITEEFEKYALDLLDTIDLVLRNPRSVVTLFGQGIGPLAAQSRVFRRAAEVLPRAHLIALRERRASLPLLERLAVRLDRVVVTGDDALEFAAQNRAAAPGAGLGINVRVASYSNLSAEDARKLSTPVQQLAASWLASLHPLPSCMYQEEKDLASIALITEGYDSIYPEIPDDPLSFTRCVQRCRIAIVASYHAAIYALAQGVPVIGLYKNAYYRDKFLGLEDLFGPGVSQ